MSFELHVAVRREGREHLAVAFDRSPITLGALPHNDVVLSDPYVSGEHATVMVSRGELVFRDTSRNGSFVDGERVREVRLGRGGCVAVPPFEIELSFRATEGERRTRYRGDATPSRPPPPPPPAADADAEAPRDTAVPVHDGGVAREDRETVDDLDPAEAGVDAGPEEDSTVLSDRLSAVPPRVRLHILHGGEIEDGEIFDLPALPAVRIGRSQSADLTLPVMTMSRLHAVVRWGDDGTILVADLGSSNGTFVNGRRLESEPRPLADGDQLRLGELISEVELVPWQGLPDLPDATGTGDAEPGD